MKEKVSHYDISCAEQLNEEAKESIVSKYNLPSVEYLDRALKLFPELIHYLIENLN